MQTYGSMVAVEVAGDADLAERVCAGTRLWVHATSLGGVESSLERRRRWPAETADVPESLAAALGRHRRRRGPVARPRRGAVVRRLRPARAYARSDFQGRDMSAPKTSRGLSPWCTTWTTCSVIGISTPCWQARS